jgi:hypothetical protein
MMKMMSRMATMASSSIEVDDLANAESWQQFRTLRVRAQMRRSGVAQFPHR